MEKLHYKIYKDGKRWVLTAIPVVALGVGLSESTYVVRADSIAPATSTDGSVNTDSVSENTTVSDTSTDNSVNTDSASESTTIPTTSTDSSVNTGSASDNTTISATSIDNSKKLNLNLLAII